MKILRKKFQKIILNLQDSYIFLQGPAGTGKTFQSGNAIVEILKKNKRVAITGNSHKVIHNVLEKVEKLATGQNFHLKDYIWVILMMMKNFMMES